MGDFLTYRNKTYRLVEVGLGSHSYCAACAFYGDEFGCDSASGCMEETGDMDTTYVWVEEK